MAGEVRPPTVAVVNPMSQTRKRGCAGVIATQHLSKLHKDAAAEDNNVIIRVTWIDADQARQEIHWVSRKLIR